jgi:predicted alpha/beta superfamily hydrolase
MPPSEPDEIRQSPVLVHGSVQFDLASKISGRTYRIFVYKPAAPPPPTGYPVVVVIDGNLMFPLAATLSGAFGLSGGQTALVVGVGYPGDDPMRAFGLRNRDLTPPTPLSRIRPIPGLPPPTAENFGGSKEFGRFLIEELRPLIAGALPVDGADQTLFGHSLGGLFTLDVLFNYPDSFRNFVASSPSIWWNRRSLLKGEAAFIAGIEAGEAEPRVLILAGAREQEMPATLPPGLTRAQTRTMMRDGRMVDNARELAERLARARAGAEYGVSFHAFEDEDHLSVIGAAVARVLTFALRPARSAARRSRE